MQKKIYKEVGNAYEAEWQWCVVHAKTCHKGPFSLTTFSSFKWRKKPIELL